MRAEDEDLYRSLSAILDDAFEAHRIAVVNADPYEPGHSAVADDEAKDIECLICGHINEADYELALLGARHELPSRY